jgi:hypothetical protein
MGKITIYPMESPVKSQKKRFLGDEVFFLTHFAAVGRAHVYSKDASPAEKTLLQQVVRALGDQCVARATGSDYCSNSHFAYIEQMSERLSKDFGSALQGDRYRIGISQKFLNLYLKYHWCLNEIPTPPHMPVDSIILKGLRQERLRRGLRVERVLDTAWTKLDSLDIYREIIDVAKETVGPNLAEWELEFWSKTS